MTNADFAINNLFSFSRTDFATDFFYTLTLFFDLSPYFVVICLSVAILAYYYRGFKYSLFFVFSVFLGAVSVYILKNIFNISRPEGGIILAEGHSFPSGHATIATIFFIMLIYIFSDLIKGYWKYVFNFLCLLAIFLVSVSRIYLGVHWFSDVYFGVFLGSILSLILIKIFENVTDTKLQNLSKPHTF
jgi:undecaprenyl-diphosphatase